MIHISAEVREAAGRLEVVFKVDRVTQDRLHTVYVWAVGGAGTEAQQKLLASQLERTHLGNAARPALLLHLGQRNRRLELGLTTRAGSMDEQRTALARFFERLPHECGAYGGWWAETAPLIEHSIRQNLGTPFSLVWFVDRASRHPHGWDAGQLRALFDEHSKLLANPNDDRFHLVCGESTRSPFVVGDFADDPRPLEDFLNLGPLSDTQGRASAPSEVVFEVSARDDEVELPELELKDPRWALTQGTYPSRYIFRWQNPADGSLPQSGILAFIPGVSTGSLSTLRPEVRMK